jgi:acyl dehydratase
MNDTPPLPRSLQSVRLTVTEASVRTYAALTGDFNPLHLDAAFAATTPMGKPIAHGTLSLCLIWQCLQRNFGSKVFNDLALDVRFVKPVFIGEEITAGGEAVLAEPGCYQVWVRGGDGLERIVGTVRVPSSM